MLSGRQASLLKIIVGEYVATAAPVGSATLVKKYSLGYSSATIRNEMAELEDAGYITHPHTSAGRVPSDRGYRFFVEALGNRTALPDSMQRTIRHQFHQVELELEEWARLASSVLARLLRNAALVTLPKGADVRVRHIELVELHATLAMLILVLQEARVKQQMVTLAAPANQETLHAVSARLNSLLSGAGAADVERIQREAPLSTLEQQILGSTLRTLQSLAAPSLDDVNLAGLADLLTQPEFNEGRRAQHLAEVLSQPAVLANVLGELLGEDQLQVVIGAEHQEQMLRDYSVVLAPYGVPGEMTGLIGVVGPTRMAYDRAISTVQYLSLLMTELVREVHG